MCNHWLHYEIARSKAHSRRIGTHTAATRRCIAYESRHRGSLRSRHETDPRHRACGAGAITAENRHSNGRHRRSRLPDRSNPTIRTCRCPSQHAEGRQNLCATREGRIHEGRRNSSRRSCGRAEARHGEERANDCRAGQSRSHNQLPANAAMQPIVVQPSDEFQIEGVLIGVIRHCSL